MGIPDHLICLLRNLYAGQEAAVRTGHGTTDWFQIGKGVRPLLTIHINNVLEDPDSTIGREEGIKDVQTGKEEIKLSLFTNDMVVYI